jgi:hypothetical protein
MPTKHQLVRHPEHVQAIGMISLETFDLELQLALLFSRMLQLSPRVGEAKMQEEEPQITQQAPHIPHRHSQARCGD